ncbi:MAG: hypothetical protein Q9191_007117 [Dirinaria sp. TL-2023a]
MSTPNATSETNVSEISPLKLGTGEALYANSILPLLSTAKHEIILVTCFWASSQTLNHLSTLLVNLSDQICASGAPITQLRVRIGFSSRSPSQKLFHTSSSAGSIYPPKTWASKLGLPSPEALKGLDLEVKSIFYRPFSVLHSKFLIVDRQTAVFPSCNISWENWLEGCITAQGPIVQSLLGFWRETWGDDDSLSSAPTPSTFSSQTHRKFRTALLPSPHYINPNFRPWPLRAPTPPATPLNTYLLRLFTNAESSIVLITPNLTSPPVLMAILSALARGVNVSILTNRRMMVLEQLLTAGTVTEICVWRLMGRYKRILNSSNAKQRAAEVFSAEEGRSRPLGELVLGYFNPPLQRERQKEPVKCHLKCTIVDDRIVVLGSGNMDRASWYTSQELGVAIEYGEEGILQIKAELRRELDGKMEIICGDWKW